jgi:hypothetical protein
MKNIILKYGMYVTVGFLVLVILWGVASKDGMITSKVEAIWNKEVAIENKLLEDYTTKQQEASEAEQKYNEQQKVRLKVEGVLAQAKLLEANIGTRPLQESEDKQVLIKKAYALNVDGNFVPINQGGLDEFLKVNGATFVKEAGDLFRKAGQTYNIKPEVIACIAQADSSLGNALKSSYNIGNVGNTDSGRVQHFSSLEEGINKIGEALNNQYMKGNTMIGQLSGGGRYVLKTTYTCDNAVMPYKCYATSPAYQHEDGYYGNWNKNVIACLQNVDQDPTIDEKFLFRIDSINQL